MKTKLSRRKTKKPKIISRRNRKSRNLTRRKNKKSTKLHRKVTTGRYLCSIDGLKRHLLKKEQSNIVFLHGVRIPEEEKEQ